MYLRLYSLCLLRFFIPKSVRKGPENTIDLLSLVIALYSLEISVIIAFLIYDLQNAQAIREKKDRIATAKLLMLSSLSDGVDYLVTSHDLQMLGPAVDIKEIFDNYRSEFDESLDYKNYVTLETVVRYLDAVINRRLNHAESHNIYQIFPEWINKIRESAFVSYFGLESNSMDCLTTDMVDLLKQLISHPRQKVLEYDDIDKERAVVMGKNGIILFERNGDKITIRDHNNDIVADGIFDEGIHGDDEYELAEGYIRTPKYVGYIKNFEYSGQGTSFNSNHEIIAEGIWENGDLIEGILHRCIIQIPTGGAHPRDYWTDSRTEVLFQFVYQYDKLYDEDGIGVGFGATADNINEFYISDLELKNGRYEIDDETRMALKYFLGQENLDLLEDIMCSHEGY